MPIYSQTTPIQFQWKKHIIIESKQYWQRKTKRESGSQNKWIRMSELFQDGRQIRFSHPWSSSMLLPNILM